MRSKGINYDTGMLPGGRVSRPSFEPDDVRRDLRMIAEELHCDAVRITGADLDRLSFAAEVAASRGLAVWFSPQPSELPVEAMAAMFEDASARAERVRVESGVETVLVLGCELSVFAPGFVPGADAYDRMRNLVEPTPELFASYERIVDRLNTFLASVAVSASPHLRRPGHLRGRTVGTDRLVTVRHHRHRRVPGCDERGDLPRRAAHSGRAGQAGGGDRVRMLHVPRRGRSRRARMDHPRRNRRRATRPGRVRP